MNDPVAQLGDARRRQPTPMKLVDRLWTVTRSVGGAPITFEAPTQEELRDLIQIAIDQHMNPNGPKLTFEELGIQLSTTETRPKWIQRIRDLFF